MLEDVASSSVSSTSVPFTVRTDVPVTDSVSSDSSNSSSIGVSVKVPVPLVSPSSMVMVNDDTLWKSTASASPLPATLTATSVASVRAPPSRVAVTTMSFAPPFSETRAGDAVSVISDDVSSLSRIVPSALASPNDAFNAKIRFTPSVSSGSSTVSSITVTVIVSSVSVDVKISVPEFEV